MRDLLSDVRATTRLVLSFAKHQQVVAEFSKLQGQALGLAFLHAVVEPVWGGSLEILRLVNR